MGHPVTLTAILQRLNDLEKYVYTHTHETNTPHPQTEPKTVDYDPYPIKGNVNNVPLEQRKGYLEFINKKR